MTSVKNQAAGYYFKVMQYGEDNRTIRAINFEVKNAREKQYYHSPPICIWKKILQNPNCLYASEDVEAEKKNLVKTNWLF